MNAFSKISANEGHWVLWAPSKENLTEVPLCRSQNTKEVLQADDDESPDSPAEVEPVEETVSSQRETESSVQLESNAVATSAPAPIPALIPTFPPIPIPTPTPAPISAPAPVTSPTPTSAHIPSPIPNPTPTPSLFHTPTPTPTPEPIPTPTSDPISTPTPDPIPTPTNDPISIPTPDPLPTLTSDPISTLTSDPISTPTPDPIPTPTSDPISTPTPDPIPTLTPDPDPPESLPPCPSDEETSRLAPYQVELSSSSSTFVLKPPTLNDHPKKRRKKTQQQKRTTKKRKLVSPKTIGSDSEFEKDTVETPTTSSALRWSTRKRTAVKRTGTVIPDEPEFQDLQDIRDFTDVDTDEYCPSGSESDVSIASQGSEILLKTFKGVSRRKEQQEFCICKLPHRRRSKVQCSHCQKWFHNSCVGIRTTEVKRIKAWSCPDCVVKTTQDSSIMNSMKQQEHLKNGSKEKDEGRRKGFCIECHKKPCRNSSVFCSDECIQVSVDRVTAEEVLPVGSVIRNNAKNNGQKSNKHSLKINSSPKKKATTPPPVQKCEKPQSPVQEDEDSQMPVQEFEESSTLVLKVEKPFSPVDQVAEASTSVGQVEKLSSEPLTPDLKVERSPTPTRQVESPIPNDQDEKSQTPVCQIGGLRRPSQEEGQGNLPVVYDLLQIVKNVSSPIPRSIARRGKVFKSPDRFFEAPVDILLMFLYEAQTNRTPVHHIAVPISDIQGGLIYVHKSLKPRSLDSKPVPWTADKCLFTNVSVTRYPLLPTSENIYEQVCTIKPPANPEKIFKRKVVWLSFCPDYVVVQYIGDETACFESSSFGLSQGKVLQNGRTNTEPIVIDLLDDDDDDDDNYDVKDVPPHANVKGEVIDLQATPSSSKTKNSKPNVVVNGLLNPEDTSSSEVGFSPKIMSVKSLRTAKRGITSSENSMNVKNESPSDVETTDALTESNDPSGSAQYGPNSKRKKCLRPRRNLPNTLKQSHYKELRKNPSNKPGTVPEKSANPEESSDDDDDGGVEIVNERLLPESERLSVLRVIANASQKKALKNLGFTLVKEEK